MVLGPETVLGAAQLLAFRSAFPRSRGTDMLRDDRAIDQNVLQIRVVGNRIVQIRPHVLVAPASKAFEYRVGMSAG